MRGQKLLSCPGKMDMREKTGHGRIISPLMPQFYTFLYVTVSGKYSASNYPKLNIRCTGHYQNKT